MADQSQPLDELYSLTLIQEAITSRLDEGAVLQLIADQAVRLAEARRAAVFLLEGDDKLCIAVTSGDQSGEDITGSFIPLAGSLVEQSILSGMPVLIADAPGDPHVRADPRRRALVEQVGIQSLLIAPLLLEGKAIGAVSLSDKVNGRFTESDERVLSVMANQAALVIENARLRRQVREAAVRQERGRMARELHDSVTQSLYSLTLFVEAALHSLPGDQKGVIEAQLERIGEIAQQALKEMRLLVYELRPPDLSESGLVGALRQRLEAVEGRAGVDAKLVVEDLVELPEKVELELYRVAQEALNNALKHARAERLRIYLRRRGSLFELEVCDDGLGFDISSVGEGGMGLDSMRTRAENLGAQFIVETAPGEGTCVKVSLELET